MKINWEQISCNNFPCINIYLVGLSTLNSTCSNKTKCCTYLDGRIASTGSKRKAHTLFNVSLIKYSNRFLNFWKILFLETILQFYEIWMLQISVCISRQQFFFKQPVNYFAFFFFFEMYNNTKSSRIYFFKIKMEKPEQCVKSVQS